MAVIGSDNTHGLPNKKPMRRQLSNKREVSVGAKLDDIMADPVDRCKEGGMKG